MSDEAVPGALELALEMAALLDELGVPYVLGGSLASSLVGEPRTTMGVDVAVELDARRAQELVVALGDEWYASPEAAAEAVRLRASFNVIHLATMLKVDLFVLGGGLLDRRQLARRRRLPIGDAGELWVGSPEDQILRKLWWYRLGGEVSERQWRDVVAMLRVQRGRLDEGDLHDAAAELCLATLLRCTELQAAG